VTSETSNGNYQSARKRPIEESEYDRGIIDLTQGKPKAKKLSLSRNKESPTTVLSKSQMTAQATATDSDDDFQNHVYNYPRAQHYASAQTEKQRPEYSDDSFSEIFPIQTVMADIPGSPFSHFSDDIMVLDEPPANFRQKTSSDEYDYQTKEVRTIDTKHGNKGSPELLTIACI
jgi:hypothetical protein